MPALENLDDLIELLSPPDLSNEQSGADYRSAVLIAIVRQLQILHLQTREDALQLHTQIIKHLYALHAIGLLTDDRLNLGFADLTRAYEREHPGLLESAKHA